jgi:hypothetical protein
VSPFYPELLPLTVIEQNEKSGQFIWRERRHKIAAISRRWRVHTAWWRDNEVWRDYWEVVTDTGYFCVLFQDKLTEEWFLERVY